MIYRISVFAMLLFIISGCGSNENRLQVDLSGITMPEVKIHRYDQDLFQVDQANLQAGLEALKLAYPFFLGTDLSDPAKLSEMNVYLNNSRNIVFQEAVKKKFPNLSNLERSMTEAFRHYKFYFPKANIPRVYTYISGGDYDHPVQLADSVMLIALDDYLGEDFKDYTADGLPLFRVSRMTPDHILPDCMRVLGEAAYPQTMPGNTLLEQMVDAGKRLYFLDAMLPSVEDRLKIGYSQKQYDWIRENEQHVWAAIIENRMLYTTDGQLIRTFMADGPFTAEFSKESPSRLGAWIGWQIIRRYMANNDEVSLSDLMAGKDAQLILTRSKYKPKK